MTKLIITAAIRVLQECLSRSPYNLELIIDRNFVSMRNANTSGLFSEQATIEILESNMES